MRAGLALGLLLASALAADGSLLLRQAVDAQPAAAIPVTLGAVGGLDTLLGSSLTNASVGSTSPLVLPILSLPADVLRVQRGALNWSVQLRVSSTSGFALGDSVTLTLVGASTQTLTVTPSTTLPATSPPVTLGSESAGGTNITVRAASGVLVVGGCGGLSTCTLTMHILLTPPGGTTPAVAYPFTLRAT